MQPCGSPCPPKWTWAWSPQGSRTCSDGVMKPGRQGSSERRHHSPAFPSSAGSRGCGSPCSREPWAWALALCRPSSVAETEPVILAWWLHQPRAVAPRLGSELEPPLCERPPCSPTWPRGRGTYKESTVRENAPLPGHVMVKGLVSASGPGWAPGAGDNGARLVPRSSLSIRGWDTGCEGQGSACRTAQDPGRCWMGDPPCEQTGAGRARAGEHVSDICIPHVLGSWQMPSQRRHPARAWQEE